MLFPQSFKVEGTITGQPDEEVIIGTLKGDTFSPADTALPADGFILFDIPENAPTGMYRIVLGQSTISKVMHEPPQKIDFIFNKEDFIFKTNFDAPLDSMEVISSEENKVWYDFLQAYNTYDKQLNDLVKQINYFQKNPDDKYFTQEKRKGIIAKYNEIQKKRNALVYSTAKKNPKLFASKLIKMYGKPFLDGNLPQSKRESIYKNNFFKNLDFSDTLLIYTPVYTHKVYEYLMAYAKKGLPREEQVKQLNKAVDVIIKNTGSNPEVADFIVNYLMQGFERLGLNEMLYHISETYSPAVPCDSVEKSTLKRRLDAQKMLPGTPVPQFSLPDIHGDTISLSDITNKYKLIIFWASWCPHCEELLPRLYQWYLNRNIDIEVIAVSIDKDQNAWKKFIQGRGYEWINCNEPAKWDGKVVNEYNIYATPTMFLVDKDNIIIYKPMDFNELLDKIIQLKDYPKSARKVFLPDSM